MRRSGGRGVVPALLVSLAGLLGAGVLAAVTARAPGSTTIAAGDQVRPASLEVEGLPEPAVPSTTAAIPTTAVATSATRPAEVPTPAPATTATTARRAPATTTARPGDPPSTLPPAILPTTTVPAIPLQHTWSATSGQLAVSVRMEPAAPVAGQPVTFTITVAPGVSCCLGSTIAFGDEDESVRTDPASFHAPAEQACANRRPVSVAKSHTYAYPAASRAAVRVVALECLPVPDQYGVATGKMVAVTVPMCVGIGPGSEAWACAL